MLTCRANQANPYERLTHIFKELLKRETGADITDLLPLNHRKNGNSKCQGVVKLALTITILYCSKFFLLFCYV
ncbi:transposase domain-containing protein [Thorsellia anophelis]|uniref:transposase domain-containing protein n=1 Tax=Thorsellia anophelis TaxID=336804 RepID=UPI000B89C9C5